MEKYYIYVVRTCEEPLRLLERDDGSGCFAQFMSKEEAQAAADKAGAGAEVVVLTHGDEEEIER